MKKLVLLSILCAIQIFVFAETTTKASERVKIIQSFNSDNNQLLKLLKSDTTNKFLGDIDLRFWIEAIQSNKKAATKTQALFTKQAVYTDEVEVVMDSMFIHLSPDMELPISGGKVYCKYNADLLCTEMSAYAIFKSNDDPSTDSLVFFGILEIGYNEQQNINSLIVKANNDEQTPVKQAEISISYNASDKITLVDANILMNADDEQLTQIGSLLIDYDASNRITQVKVNAWDSDLEAIRLVLVANASYNASALPELTEVVQYYRGEENAYDGVRITWTYENEMIDDLIVSYLDEDSTWLEEYKYNYDYNIDKTVSQTLLYEYDTINDQWIEDYKRLFYYTDFGKIERSLELSYNVDSSAWLNSDVDSFMYNSNEQLIESKSYYWNHWNDIYFWKYSSIEQYTYDANNRVSLFVYYYGSSTYEYGVGSEANSVTQKWIKDDSITFTRNIEGKLTSVDVWDYSTSDSSWHQDMLDTITYDNQGRPTGLIQYYWDNDTTMVGEINIQIDRDANDNLSYFKAQGWNDTLEMWDYYVEVSVEYDPQTNLVMPKVEVPDYLMNAIKKVAYSNGFNIDSLRYDFYPNPILSAYFFGYQSVDDILADFKVYNLPTKVTVGINTKDMQTDELGICNMYYSAPSSSIEDASYQMSDVAAFYPNPADHYIQFKNITSNGTFAIYSINGVLITKEVISTDTQLDISYIAPGVYITTLNVNGTITNSKLIVE